MKMPPKALKASRLSFLIPLARKTLPLLLIVIVGVFTSLKAPLAYEQWLVDKVASRTVKILNLKNAGGGTGFLIQTSKGAKILTNRHICDLEKKSGKFFIYFEDGNIELGQILKISNKSDLCLIDLPDRYEGLFLGEPPIKLQKITTFGHPYLEDLQLQEGRLISELTMYAEVPLARNKPELCNAPNEFFDRNEKRDLICMIKQRSYLSTFNIQPGASGSPVVDEAGNVVAVVFAYLNATHQGLLIPFEDVKDFLSDI